MADITLKLIWYKLGEHYKNLGAKYERFLEWYEDFSWRRVDILDMLFLGWLLLAFVVVAAINLYLRFFGLPKYRKRGAAGQAVSIAGAEKTEWLNGLLSWVYAHYKSTPEIIETWLRALTEEAKHHAVGEYQMRFDRVQPGCPPPRILRVATDTTNQDSMTVRADIDSADSVLQVALIQQTATSVKVSNCDVSITKLSGQLRLHGTCMNDEIQVSVGFVVPPQMVVTAKPRNYDANLDQKLVESMVRSAISGAVFNVAFSSHGGFPSFFAASNVKANGNVPANIQAATDLSMPLPHPQTSPPQNGSLRLRRNQHKSPVLGTLSLVGSPVESTLGRSTLSSVRTVAPSSSPPISHSVVYEREVSATSKARPICLVSEEKLSTSASCEVYKSAPPRSAYITPARLTTSKNSPYATHSIMLASRDQTPRPKSLTETARSSRILNEAPIQATNASSVSAAAPGSRSLQGHRLLVKVIKANGLGDKDFGCADPYCVVLFDEPPQRHTTSVVRNTVNPFWDEHFIFDLDDYTKQVKFEVYNQGKSMEDEFLGRATVQMDELRRMPSSRQIVPLTGRPGASTTTSGSVTVEFLFMDGPHESQLSPKRRIETSRLMMPGGTMVTTTTTTTERPKDQQGRVSPFHHDTPSQIEKTDLLSRGPGGVGTASSDYPYNRQSSLNAHDAALNASHDPLVNGRPDVTQTALKELETSNRGVTPANNKPKSTTLIITSVQRDSDSIPIIQTSETSPYADGGTGSMCESTSTLIDEPPVMRRPRAEVKKSKSFASTLKKRFARPKKSRSQSADRAQTSSLREGSLLKPPTQQSPHKTDDDLDQGEFQDGRMRKSRSHSFSSSLKKLFKGGKKGSGRKDASRESSLSRASGRYEASREGSVGVQHSPNMSYNNRDLTLRHSTPTPDYEQNNYPYSMSVPPNPSPLYDH